MSQRDDAISGYKQAAAAMAEAVSGLNEEAASLTIIDRWSIKDHVNHLTLWHEMRFFEIKRCAAGRPAAFPLGCEDEIETINNTYAGLRRHLSLKDALADLNSARSAIVHLIGETPEEGLDPARYQEMGPAGGAYHELNHIAMIAAARQREGI